MNPVRPTPEARRFCDNAEQAVAYAQEIYEANVAYLRECFSNFTKGQIFDKRVTAYYPYAALTTTQTEKIDTRLSFGFVAGTGTFRITLTRPDVFKNYYAEQFRLLLRNHHQPIEIGVSLEPIPVHFAFADGIHVEEGLTPDLIGHIRNVFDMPSLAEMDDSIVDGRCTRFDDGTKPLGLFTAARVDYSLHRLRHYTATNPCDFQNFVIFTNYQFYVDEFVRIAHDMMQETSDPALRKTRSQYTALVEPGGRVTSNANLGARAVTGELATRIPQMPAYHLQRADGNGITIINIGVGPSNAKNITDHVAVLRPHAWLMLGHCAGLSDSQRIGDYVLAHAYVRDEQVLNRFLPQWVPVPALAEVQKALETATADITGKAGYDTKLVLRTGTVVTVDNRNWEIGGYEKLVERFSKSRAIALDMESATIAANGFRFRVPYGTLLCVSDKPMHGEIKLPGMANRFYKDQVDQHLKIGMRAMELLREYGLGSLHSRKLRSFVESAFQ